MKHTRKRLTALLAATLCCANAIAQTDWGQIHRRSRKRKVGARTSSICSNSSKCRYSSNRTSKGWPTHSRHRARSAVKSAI